MKARADQEINAKSFPFARLSRRRDKVGRAFSFRKRAGRDGICGMHSSAISELFAFIRKSCRKRMKNQRFYYFLENFVIFFLHEM